jgi:hypothetical protein
MLEQKPQGLAKRLLAVLGAVILACAIGGCGSAPAKSDAADKAFAGTWEAVSLVDADGNQVDSDAYGKARALGLNTVLTLGDDGSASCSMWGDEGDGTWSASAGEGSLSMGGTRFDGGKLSLEDDTLVVSWQTVGDVTFKRNPDAKVTPSDYKGALTGTWEVVYGNGQQGEQDESVWNAARQQGVNVVLKLNEDSTACMYLNTGNINCNWAFLAPSHAQLTKDNETIDVAINDSGLLVMKVSNETYACRKNPDAMIPEVTQGAAEAPSADAANGQGARPTGSLNAEAFNSIQNGMSYQEVVALLGSEGELESQSESGGTESRLYTWEDDSWGIAQVMFMDDKVVNKTQIGVGGDSAAPVTAAQYEQVAEGMSYEQVVAIMGGEGQLVSDTGIAGVSMQFYTWDGKTFGSNCTICFYNGAVESKSQLGLE